MAAPRYPGAHFIRSPETAGLLRDATFGVVWHWTAGVEAGDVRTLSQADPRSVNVQFYIAKDGNTPSGPGIYQFTETDERANHGFHTANHTMVGVEMESLRGEPWTDIQTELAVALGAWLSNLYDIPIVHCDPVGHTISSFRGHCGHIDLGGVDGNNHTDTVTNPPGWDRFLEAMRNGGEVAAYYFEAMPYDQGGVGPKVLGDADGYAKQSVRDDKFKDVEAANPDLTVTKMSDGERFYILGWGNLAGREWYRSGNFADDTKRDVEMAKRKTNLPAGAKALRKFQGKQYSLYPWPT